MKKYKILTAALAAAVLSGASSLAAFNYQNGDLIAAFGNGGSTDVIVDLGSLSSFKIPDAPPLSYDLSAVVNDTFGGVSSSLYWSVFIGDDSTSTVYNTLKRSNPANQTTRPFVGGNADSQALVVGDMSSIANLNSPGQAAPGLIVDYAAGIEQVAVSLGGYSAMMTGSFNGNFQGDWTYNILNNGAGTSDFYQSDPGNHLTQRAAYLGNFNFSPEGLLTFNPAPEPATWALMGMGTVALMALRRRK